MKPAEIAHSFIEGQMRSWLDVCFCYMYSQQYPCYIIDADTFINNKICRKRQRDGPIDVLFTGSSLKRSNNDNS